MVQLGPRRQRRTFVRLIAVAAVLVLITAGVGTPAEATHDYDGIVPVGSNWPHCAGANAPNDIVCQTDNAALWWYADSNDPGELEANDVDALEDILADEYAPTILTIHYDSTPVFSGSGETDLILQEAEAALPLPGQGILGVTWCNDAVSSELWECDQTYIRIASPDGYRIHGGSVTCHEIGHAVGLVHGNNASPWVDPGAARLGCMVNEDEFPNDLGAASTHQINLVY